MTFILFTYAFIIFIAFLILTTANLSELSLGDIEEHITNRQWIKPLCILFIEKAQCKIFYAIVSDVLLMLLFSQI